MAQGVLYMYYLSMQWAYIISITLLRWPVCQDT